MNEAEVAVLLREQFPQLGPLPVKRLGEGLDHVAFEVGGRFVFRFPKSEEVAAALSTEIRLTAWLASLLPLPIPAYQFVGAPGARFARLYAGYPKMEGAPALLERGEQAQAAALGRRLGEFLRALHGADAGTAAALGLEADDDPHLKVWSDEALRDLQFAQERGHVEAASRAAWALRLTNPPPAASSPGRVVHGDFAAEHVLLDGQGRPSGVIDWSDAVLGDPALDLAGLVHWGGRRLLLAALETYGAAGEATLERARWYALCRALADIRFGEVEGRDVYASAGRRALGWLEQEFW